jgi:uncharacterized protein DUF3108
LIPLREQFIHFIIMAVAASACVLAQAPSKKKNPAPAPSPSPTPAGPVLSAPSLARPRPDHQLPVGQTYIYGGEWRIFNAGTATLRMEQAGRENRVIGTALATGTVALLFHVQDRYESFFDPANFCSHNTSRHIEEGLRRVDTNVAFDYKHRKVVFDQKNIRKKESKHQEHELSNCVTDMISGIYYVASLPLLPGGMYTFPLNDGGETLNVTVRVEARERVKTPAGTFDAIRVHPESAGGLLKKGKLWIWYSDDSARVPVQARAHMSWGTLTLTLQRIDKK